MNGTVYSMEEEEEEVVVVVPSRRELVEEMFSIGKAEWWHMVRNNLYGLVSTDKAWQQYEEQL